jgi:hypothetical protein
MNPIEPFGSTSTYRKSPGKGIFATVRSSAVMKEVALLPQGSSGRATLFRPWRSNARPNNLCFGMYRPAYSQHTQPYAKSGFVWRVQTYELTTSQQSAMNNTVRAHRAHTQKPTPLVPNALVALSGLDPASCWAASDAGSARARILRARPQFAAVLSSALTGTLPLKSSALRAFRSQVLSFSFSVTRFTYALFRPGRCAVTPIGRLPQRT